MANYSDKILEEFALAEDELMEVTQNEFEQVQINDVLTKIGAKTEIFLKSVVFPAENSRNTFEWFINRLNDESISRISIDYLHELRRKYNKAKHDPQTDFELLYILEVIRNAKNAIEEVNSKNLGSVKANYNPRLKRLFWIAVWDHFIHGDSEVHIILPGQSGHWLGPPTFDIIYVEISAWYEIKDKLGLLGILKEGKGLIPESQYKIFRSDEDFLGAWVFEGDYKSLITTLAEHELRQKLLPGLNRHDNFTSIIIACLLATVDVITSVEEEEDLPSLIKKQMADVYAVPYDYFRLDEIAKEMASMVSQLDFEDWKKVTGPYWISSERFNELSQNARAKHTNYQIIIDVDLVLKMELNT
jgi:hypothetical protein